MAVPLVEALRKLFSGSILCLHDPVANPTEVRQTFGQEPEPSLAKTFEGASLVVIATNHPSFEVLDLELINIMARPAIVYDMWNLLSEDELSLPNEVFYVGLGDGRMPLNAE